MASLAFTTPGQISCHLRASALIDAGKAPLNAPPSAPEPSASSSYTTPLLAMGATACLASVGVSSNRQRKAAGGFARGKGSTLPTVVKAKSSSEASVARRALDQSRPWLPASDEDGAALAFTLPYTLLSWNRHVHSELMFRACSSRSSLNAILYSQACSNSTPSGSA